MLLQQREPFKGYDKDMNHVLYKRRRIHQHQVHKFLIDEHHQASAQEEPRGWPRSIFWHGHYYYNAACSQIDCLRGA